MKSLQKQQNTKHHPGHPFSLKRNIKIPPRSCAVVDVDINTTEELKVEIIPDQLWLSANPNICTYPMIADLKERKQNTITPFIIVNFSHHEHLHLPKDHVVGFAEKGSRRWQSTRNLHHGGNSKRIFQGTGYLRENDKRK